MGMTQNQLCMVRMLAENNIPKAKQYAVACCVEDTTQKNKMFVAKYKEMLQAGEANLLELPYDLMGLLEAEDVSSSFIEDRYYLADREAQLFSEIIKMQQASEKLMEMGIPYLNATLLYGESGTGKTTFGRYVAYKTGLPFCYMRFSNLIDSYMGNTSKNIAKAFAYIKNTPCVFMMDELDCISIRRSSVGENGGASGEMARVTIGIMQELDKLPNNVLLLAATNREDRIDDAIKRRFSIIHKVKPFTVDEKREMIKKYLTSINMVFEDIELKELSELEENQSGVLTALIRKIAEKVS